MVKMANKAFIIIFYYYITIYYYEYDSSIV